MKYVINGSYYNWITHNRNQMLAQWIYWQRDRQLASGGEQRKRKGKRK